MKRSGFTLIEVIAVIVVLSIIILTIVPNISDSLKNSRNKAYDTQIVEIKDAARAWSALNSSNLPTNSSDKKIITLLQLKLSGLISYNYTNAKTGKLFPDDMQIEIKKKGLTYEYNVLIDSGTSNSTINPLGPQIVLNGSSYLYLEVNSNAIIPNAIYKDINNNYVEVTDVKYQVYGEEDVTTENIINMSELGKYNIIYTANVNGIVNSIKRYVEIRDTTPPIIEIEGYTNGQTLVYEINDTFTVPTATYNDNYTNSVSIIKETISNFSKVPGIKQITYKATDTSNNQSEFILYVDVKDTTPPIIVSTSIQYNEALSKEVATVEAIDEGIGLHELPYSFDNGKTWQKDNYLVINDEDKQNFALLVRDKLGNQKQGLTLYEQNEYVYTGREQEFIAPRNGYYKIELWGAQGGKANTISGGKGGYSEGITYLEANQKLYISVGGKGEDGQNTANYITEGGYNGGGTGKVGATAYYVAAGGGATHVAKTSGLLSTLEDKKSDILIVAAGGGGASYLNDDAKALTVGHGGGLIGENGTGQTTSGTIGTATGGKQTSGNAFGQGANGTSASRAGGGGGYYGGLSANYSAGGGSSFIRGYAGVDPVTLILSSTNYFINGKMKSGVNEGNGKARISYIGESKPERVNTKLNNVRYIKDCINGNTANGANHWVELQAIKDGVNIAKDKMVIGTVNAVATYKPYDIITDGDMKTNPYSSSSKRGLQCITVDLESDYDLDEIAVWHYWADNRTYYENVTYVSSDNNNWTPVINNNEPETSNGKRVNAYEREEYKEIVLNGAYPKLDSAMTPIYYDGNVAKVADITDEWYSYKNSLWANAVLIKEDKREDYQKANKVVSEDDILAYFVWIPRYEYTIKGTYGVNGTSAKTPGYIDIRFASSEKAKVSGTATYTGTSPDNYLTHPAFTLGDKELSGIWVGKFETTGTRINTTTPITNPTIKPGITSLKNQNVSTQYLTSLNFKNYGLESMSRMMKNDEWGAVAYLSQSLYGRCEVSGTCEEIMRNNNSDYLTGYAAVNAATTGSSNTSSSTNQHGTTADVTQPYNTEVGYKASTTGNISGIYDMSGGAYEYMMTVLADSNGNPRSGYTAIEYTAEQAATILGKTGGASVPIRNSGFNGLVYGKDLDNETLLYVTNGRNFPETKYYNLYTSTNRDTACNGGKCYGHANSETPGWYGDSTYMPSSDSPWGVRGGSCVGGTSAGLFTFDRYYGNASGYFSFRTVVTD